MTSASLQEHIRRVALSQQWTPAMPAKVMPVTGSSNIAGVGYDADTQELAIRFHSGRTYVYDGVPQDVHDDLMAASSMGQYFNTFIKDRYSAR